MRHKRVLALTFLASVFFLNSGMRMLAANWLKLRHLRQQIVELKNEESKLLVRRASAGRGSPAVEKAARLDLGMIRPDEIEYRFPPPDPKQRKE